MTQDKTNSSHVELSASSGNDADYKYHTEIPYYVYQNRNPFLRLYDEAYYHSSKFDRWTETRFFEADQLQDCIASEYADRTWEISSKDKEMLAADLQRAVGPRKAGTEHEFVFKLGLYYSFERALPALARTARSN